MVIVLAAAGEARGGRLPTATERALEAKARGKLGAVVEEAVCALIEDLRLDRAYDPDCHHGVQPRAGPPSSTLTSFNTDFGSPVGDRYF
jgi:hypothetical protein